MSGFFVSNSFGHFNSESDNKKFNAVTLKGFPDGVTSISGRKMRQQIRTATAPNQYLYSGTAGNKKGSGWAHQYENDWIPPSNNVFFNRWTNNDQAVMRDDENSMQYFRPAKNVRMKVKIGFYDCTHGKTNYNYTTYELGIPSKYVTKTGHREIVEVWLDGNSDDYIFVDFDDDLSSNSFDQEVAKSSSGAAYAVVIKCEEGIWKSHHDPDADSCSTVFIQPVEAVYTKEGCTDKDATNYDPMAGVKVGCKYTRAVPSLTLNKTEVREGSPVKISWVLDNSANKGYSKIELYDGGKKIKTSTSKSSYYNYTPTGVGNHPISIKVLWSHGVQPPDQKQTLSVVDAVTFITCTDPNREKDNNNECAACNTNYYLGDAGLCIQCDDPNRDMDNDGRCTDCKEGYALQDGDCIKSGCMDEDNYEYDPDAVIDDPSACADPDSTGNGGGADVDCELSDWSDWSEWSTAGATDGVGVGPCGTRTRIRTVVTAAAGNGAVCEHLEEEESKDCSTGETVITTMGGDTTPVIAPTTEPETKSLAAPLIIAGIALVIGVFVMRR